MPRWPNSQSSIARWRAVDHHGRLDRRGRLRRFESAGGRKILGVAEGEPADGHVLDEFLLGRIALDQDKPLDHRGDHPDLVHLLARQRAIVKDAVAREEPFTRRIEGREEVLQVIGSVALPGVPRLHPLAAGHQRLPRAVEAVDESPGIVPLVVDHEVHVAEFLGRKIGENLEIAGPHDHGLHGLLGPSRGRLGSRFLDALDVEIELIGRSRPGRAAAVHEQLFEVPVAGGDFRDLGGPHAVAPRSSR